MAWARHGSGPPLLIVSCWLSHLQHDWHSPVWRHFLDDLGDIATVVRYDERGFGLSDWAVEDFSLERRLADLETLVEATGLSRFAVLGMSGGAPVALAYAHAHPERVTRMVLYGAMAAGGMTQEDSDEEAAFLAMIRAGWARPDPLFRRVFTNAFIPDASEQQMEWMDELQRTSTNTDNAVCSRIARHEIDVSHLLPDIAVPTLVLHADDDRVAPEWGTEARGRHPRRPAGDARLAQPRAALRRAGVAGVPPGGRRLHRAGARVRCRSTTSPTGSGRSCCSLPRASTTPRSRTGSPSACGRSSGTSRTSTSSSACPAVRPAPPRWPGCSPDNAYASAAKPAVPTAPRLRVGADERGPLLIPTFFTSGDHAVPTKKETPMSNKAVVSLATGLEDPERVTVAFLVAVAAAEQGRPTLMFLTKEAVRLATPGVAVGTACDGCPPLPELLERYLAAGGSYLVCPLCFNARALDPEDLIKGAELGGTVPMWQWIGDEGATSFSY